MPPTWVVATYDGPPRALLLDLKERGAAALARPLGVSLARALRAAADGCQGPIVVVPVPSAPVAIRRRGDDVVRLLAEQAARRLRKEGVRHVTVVTALRQQRRITDSAGLAAADRMRNLAGALAVRPSAARMVRDRPVVVVDDLVTTGATFVEATRALGAVGAGVVGAAAVAATRRRGTGSWAEA